MFLFRTGLDLPGKSETFLTEDRVMLGDCIVALPRSGMEDTGVWGQAYMHLGCTQQNTALVLEYRPTRETWVKEQISG